MQLVGIGLVSLASAIVLIMVGSIPVLGVIIPNITARLYGDQVHKTIGITHCWEVFSYFFVISLLAW